MIKVKDTGLTTIEQARLDFEDDYEFHKENDNWWLCLLLKCWKYHSESRHRNGNSPFTFYNYSRHMNAQLVLEQIELDMIDCSDLCGKEDVIKKLNEKKSR